MCYENSWIWQASNYPNFRYDSGTLDGILSQIKSSQDTLTALSRSISERAMLDCKIEILANEIIGSSLIENEILQRKSVRSSIKKKLDRDFNRLKNSHSTRQTDNLTAILLDTNLNKNPLNIDRLHGWHNAIFESGYSGLHRILVAQFRADEMSVVEGAIGFEKTIYEAIPQKDIIEQMEALVDFCNNASLNPFLKSAIAHLWFVIIHPYDDGNGRIARAIADYLLPNDNIKFYSISSEIAKNKKEYYDILEQTTKNNSNCDISAWIKWHLTITNQAIKSGIATINNVVFKSKFWDRFKNISLSSSQQKVLNMVLDTGVDNFVGKINVQKYASITHTDKIAAQKEIDELVRLGCLAFSKDGKGYILNTDIKTNLPRHNQKT